MAPTIDSIPCNDNGVWLTNAETQFDYGTCKCHRCYHGVWCQYVIPTECHGTIEPSSIYTLPSFNSNVPPTKVEKCKCSFNQTGDCCDQKKCLGSNRTPDPVTGKCNCSDPEIRSGEFCEKINCKNGVTRVTGGKCDCSGYDFNGKFCDKIICYNSGIPNHNNSECLCKNGFSGLHCQSRPHDNDERHNTYSSQSTESTSLYKGDDSHELSGQHVAAIVVPVVLLLGVMFAFIIARKYTKKNSYAAAAINYRHGASGPDQETSLYTNPAQPSLANTNYLNRPDRLVSRAPNDERTTNQSNNVDLPSYEIALNNNTIRAGPSSINMDPPSYEEAVKMSSL